MIQFPWLRIKEVRRIGKCSSENSAGIFRLPGLSVEKMQFFTDGILVSNRGGGGGDLVKFYKNC
jgi:hypothetical protein